MGWPKRWTRPGTSSWAPPSLRDSPRDEFVLALPEVAELAQTRDPILKVPAGGTRLGAGLRGLSSTRELVPGRVPTLPQNGGLPTRARTGNSPRDKSAGLVADRGNSPRDKLTGDVPPATLTSSFPNVPRPGTHPRSSNCPGGLPSRADVNSSRDKVVRARTPAGTRPGASFVALCQAPSPKPRTPEAPTAGYFSTRIRNAPVRRDR